MRLAKICCGLLAVAACALMLAPDLACTSEGCLTGSDDDCIVPSPCQKLRFECTGEEGAVSAKLVSSLSEVPGGLDALGKVGDIRLANDQVVAIIDALDHPHYVGPTGGALLDLSTVGSDNDSLNLIVQATGLLPEDAAHYTQMRLIDGDGYAAVQFRGHLDGHDDHRISTRYEVRPCEPGVRIRTEVVNLEPDDAIWSATDGWYWSGREALPFTPYPGAGFEHPSFGLSDIADVFREVPFMAAAGHTDENLSAAYAVVSCNEEILAGFQSDQLSAVGLRRRIVPPRDYVVFERFIAVSNGTAISPVVDLALEARRQLLGEEFVTISGRVLAGGVAPSGGEVRATVVISEGTGGTAPSSRVPWTQAKPNAEGRFEARVPKGRSYIVEVRAFGRLKAQRVVGLLQDSVDVGTLEIPLSGSVTVQVKVGSENVDALTFFHPADDLTRETTAGKLLGAFSECAPLLGPPHGGSPACNRVLSNAPVTVQVPPGKYDLYATIGPFATIQRRTVDVFYGGTSSVTFELSRLDVAPPGTLSADFHVHGASSFDSSIPDRDRVRAFLASSIDVIAATDHDVVSDYREAVAELNVGDRIVLMTGLETTGHILFKLLPDTHIPKVIGHWNFWPLERDPELPRNGAPWDELVEPAVLFERMQARALPDTPIVVQLNHPWAEAEFGRDLGFPRALEIDAREPVPPAGAETGPELFLRTPPDARSSNADYHTQEVMNGTENAHFLPYRAFWFRLLNQGIIKAGTANSDSHGLTDNVLGTPRTLVFTDVTKERFDVNRFNEQVRRGRMVGTNGPVIEITTTDVAGATRTPSIDAFAPGDEAKLEIQVSAAPWVPVEEVRIVVNGRVVRTLRIELSAPFDPFGSAGIVRFSGNIALASLLPRGKGDAWLIVEAGTPLAENGDLDCNGMPDTGDNNGDGIIDWRDVDRNDDDLVDRRDEDVNEDGEINEDDVPEECDDDNDVGPLAEPPKPRSRSEARYHFRAVTPGGYPLAFTNPLLFD